MAARGVSRVNYVAAGKFLNISKNMNDREKFVVGLFVESVILSVFRNIRLRRPVR